MVVELCHTCTDVESKNCVEVHPPCITSVKFCSLSSTELLATQENVSFESLSIRLLSVYCTLCRFESSNAVWFSTISFPVAFLLLISTNVAAGTALARQKRDRLVPRFLLTVPVWKVSSSGATGRERI